MKAEQLQQPQIIRALVQQGLTHSQAERALTALLNVIAGAVLNRQAVKLGRIGVIEPRTIPPRTYTIGCIREPGGKFGQKVEYFAGTRIKYRLRLFDTFAKAHALK